jgi:hypothetical protein
MDVIPAPRRAPRRRVDDVPTRRVTLLPPAVARAEPSAVEASWLEARDTVEGDWAMPAGEVAVETALEVGPVAPWAAPGDAAPAGPGVPHTSQYPSTTVPVHPGSAQAPATPPMGEDVPGTAVGDGVAEETLADTALGDAVAAPAGPGDPHTSQ